MTNSNSFLNEKIETVNAKFATSILTDTITKLSLLQCAQRADDHVDAALQTKKFSNDLAQIKRSFYRIIINLRDHQNFTDFSGVSVAENESNFLIEYASNKEKFGKLCRSLLELEADIANFRVPLSTVDENILRCAIENRFIKNWEKARRDQNDHFTSMQTDDLQNAIDNYSRNIELEKVRMVEIETYSLLEMDTHKAESIRWSEKFDADLNQTEMDIQMAIAELERTKLNFEKTVEEIRFRAQEMVDFVALNEERAAQKDSYMMKMLARHRDYLFAQCGIFGELSEQ